MVGPTMNLISRTYYLSERRGYALMVLREYIIIFADIGLDMGAGRR